ncbi:hypothetical protein BD413DRAFT_611992 [Trametes elegans]|nr:hypothetical protein BD413DRAFT_611992 [Trametes elegans]
MAAFPPPPALSAQASQDVFTYPNELPADHPRRIANDRLVYLGRMQAEIVFTEIMLQQSPAISTHLHSSMLARFMVSVARAYEWSRQVQGYPRQGFNWQSPQEAQRIFCAYAGAVHLEHQYGGLRQWMVDLVHAIGAA